MTKNEYIEYWRSESEENRAFAQRLLDSTDWVYALFFFHLTLEKLFKAVWVKDNIDNVPPRTHDLQHLHNQTNLNLNAEDYAYLAVISSWNLETHYPDYKRKIYQRTDERFARKQLEIVDSLRKCLLNSL